MSHSHTVSANQADPSRTGPIIFDYEQAMAGWYEALAQKITPTSFNQEDIEDPPQVYEFETRDDKVQKFVEWLNRQQRVGVLRIINRNSNVYIERAYEEGIEHAERSLRELGLPVDEASRTFALPVHAQTLEDLYERNFEQFEDVTEDQAQDIRETLTRGFAEGKNPRTIAREMSESVRGIGVNRSRKIARTEVINAHSEATLNRFEQMGIEEVGVQAEWVTAGDSRVCPICRALAGRTYTVDEIRNTNFRFSPPEDSPNRHLAGLYPKKPPAHPNCRCVLVPAL